MQGAVSWDSCKLAAARTSTGHGPAGLSSTVLQKHGVRGMPPAWPGLAHTPVCPPAHASGEGQLGACSGATGQSRFWSWLSRESARTATYASQGEPPLRLPARAQLHSESAISPQTSQHASRWAFGPSSRNGGEALRDHNPTVQARASEGAGLAAELCSGPWQGATNRRPLDSRSRTLASSDYVLEKGFS